MNKVKVLAIPATNRHGVTQQEVMKKLRSMNGFDLNVKVFDKLADLPLYISAADTDPSDPVVNFCQTIRAIDAVVLYLPEINFGVPGTLINALKWALQFDLFKDKFVALVTTSKPKNTTMQGIINAASSQLYPVTTLRIYYLPPNLDGENQSADIQCIKTMQNIIADIRQNANKKKVLEFA